MKEPVINFKIEKSVIDSNIKEDKIARIIEALSSCDTNFIRARISGHPLHVYNSNAEAHFSECDIQLQEPVAIGRIYTAKIPSFGHPHIPKEFVDDNGYPVMQCFDGKGNELIMGMKSVLGFEIEIIDTD